MSLKILDPSSSACPILSLTLLSTSNRVGVWQRPPTLCLSRSQVSQTCLFPVLVSPET